MKYFYLITIISLLALNISYSQSTQPADTFLIPRATPLLPLLEPPDKVEGIQMTFEMERELYENGDTSFTWKGLYEIDPDLLFNLDIPTWKIGYPLCDSIIDFMKVARNMTKVFRYYPEKFLVEYMCLECKNKYAVAAPPEGARCTHCGSFHIVKYSISQPEGWKK